MTVTAVLVGMLGLLALTQHGRWPWLLAVLGAAFVADSRLVLGVHWFSDVAIGLVLGLGWGVAVALTLQALDARCAAQPDRTAGVAVAN